MTDALPYSHSVDLSSLSEAGRDEAFTVPQAACRAIAAFYEIDGLEDFSARFHLSRLAKDEYEMDGHFSATVLQTCIVTLNPMRTALDQDFARRYHVIPRSALRHAPATVDIQLSEDEVETLSGSSLDLAVPLLEELSLMIDPYPRSPGAEFGQGGQTEPERESPFAILKALKDRLEPPEKT
jgi:uncharacterized metal-binding protein YceD (DUF177 family)